MSKNVQSTKDEMQDLTKFLYTTTSPDEAGPEKCVFVFDERRVVTFHHGVHKKLFSEVGAEITIYPARNRDDASEVLPVQMKVECFDHYFDFVVLQTKDGEPTFRESRPAAPIFPHVGTNYTMIGIAEHGVIMKKGSVLTHLQEGSIGFMIGDSVGGKGDAGAGLISNGHFLGLAIGRLNGDLADKNLKERLNLEAHPVSYTCFVSGSFIIEDLDSTGLPEGWGSDEDEEEMPSTSEKFRSEGEPPTKINKM